MHKLTIAVLAVTFAGTASAAGWRSMQIDGSGEEGFAKSVAELREELPPARRYVFVRALQDIWVAESTDAEAKQQEYTAEEYLAQLDGLRYKDVVKLADPSGDTTRQRYRDAYVTFARRGRRAALAELGPAQRVPASPPGPIGFSGEQVRGVDNQVQGMQQRLADKGHLH
jgi:hypothetical protein